MTRASGKPAARFSWMVVFFLCACSSAPLRYHTLEQADRPLPARSGMAVAPLFIEFNPVNVPLTLNTSQMMVSKADGTLRVAEQDKWASPFPEELRTALSSELQARLPAIDASRLAMPSGQHRYRISTDVVRAGLDARQRFVGVMQWSVRRLPEGETRFGQTVVDVITDGQLDSQVAAYRQFETTAAADIAGGVQSLQTGQPQP